jgi:signal transduction histidine kinase
MRASHTGLDDRRATTGRAAIRGTAGHEIPRSVNGSHRGGTTCLVLNIARSTADDTMRTIGRTVLHDFITANREEIVRRCRVKVSTRSPLAPAGAELDHGVPIFLDQLVDTLQLGLTSSLDITSSAARHGHDLLRRGFTVSQVVHDYGDVCQAVTELAVASNVRISTEDFRTLNRCLDEAIAGAVTEYDRARDQSTLDHAEARSSERLGFFAHELRNTISSAIMAFEVLKTGNVGVVGSTGTVLHRSLFTLQALIGRSLAEARLTQGIQKRERFLVSGFIDELVSAATLDVQARGLRLSVMTIEEGLAIEADRQILAAVMGSLLQNACRFTRPRSTVTLAVGASADRVRIEVHDECDGLSTTNINDLFRPIAQRRGDGTGVGLGLAFSRWGVEANHGRISARNLPTGGCAFTVDLPRVRSRHRDV